MRFECELEGITYSAKAAELTLRLLRDARENPNENLEDDARFYLADVQADGEPFDLMDLPPRVARTLVMRAAGFLAGIVPTSTPPSNSDSEEVAP